MRCSGGCPWLAGSRSLDWGSGICSLVLFFCPVFDLEQGLGEQTVVLCLLSSSLLAVLNKKICVVAVA